MLIELLNSPHLELVEQVIWLLGNIAGNSAEDRDLVINAGVIIPISNILDRAQPGSSLIRNVSWTLSNFSRNTKAENFELAKRAY